MPGSDRLFLIALAGLALLGITFGLGVLFGVSDQPKEQRYQPYRYTTDKPSQFEATTLGQAVTQPLEYRTPCKQPKGKDESELCAEWRSAKAGEESAAWAQRAFWLSAAGILALLWQLILTRKAVKDTGLALEIAKSSADVASDSHKAFIESERARLRVFSPGELSIHHDQGEWSYAALIEVDNIGRLHATVSEVRWLGVDAVQWPADFSTRCESRTFRRAIANGAHSVGALDFDGCIKSKFVVGCVMYDTLSHRGCVTHFVWHIGSEDDQGNAVSVRVAATDSDWPHDT